MLVQSISIQNLNTIRMNCIQHKSEVKSKELGIENANTSALPSYSTAGSYANISFRGGDELLIAVNYDDVETLREELKKGTNINARDQFGDTAITIAGDERSTKCFKELRKHPELDIYAEDKNGWMCFAKGRGIKVTAPCDDPDFDVNYQSKKTGDNGLIAACRDGKEEAVDIILERNDVDLTLRNKADKSAFDYAEKYPSILKKLKNYEKRQKELAEQKQAEQKYPDKSEIYARAKEMGYDIDKMNNYKLKKYEGFTSTTNDYGNTRLMQAALIDDKEEFDRLLNDPDTDVNEKDIYGFTIIQISYIWLGVTRRDMNILYYAKKVLQHPDVDTSSYLNHVKQCDFNTKHKDFAKLDSMVRSYQRGVDKRTKSIPPTETKEVKKELSPEEKIQKLLTFKDIWTEEEKANVEKLIKKKNYAELASLLVTKADAINNACINVEKIIADVTAETQKSVRETETAKIHEEEKQKAEDALAKKQTKLDEQLEEAKKKEKTFNSLIEKTQSLIDQGIEDAKRGFVSLFNIDEEYNIPEHLDFLEQMVFVTNILAKNKNKIKSISDDLQQNITHALQNKNGNISNEGLKFLDRILTVNETSYSEEDLITAIKTVKSKGNIDTQKAAFFVSSLTLGYTVKNVVEKVKKCSVKV